MTGAVHHPLNAIVPVLLPLIAIIIKNLRTPAKASAEATSAEARS